MKQLWERFTGSSTGIKVTIITVVAVWLLALAALSVALLVSWERPIVAEPPSLDLSVPAISLEPMAGPLNTVVTIQGRGWEPGSTVLLYLTAPDEIELLGYAVSSAVVDPEGQFLVSFVILPDPRWEATGLVRLVARTMDSAARAQVFYGLVGLSSPPTAAPPTPGEPTPSTVEPTATPTLVVPPTSPTVQLDIPKPPDNPRVTATTDLNIRTGPGTVYPVLGLLRLGQTAEVIGVSPDGRWWQVQFAGSANGRAWVSGRYVTAENTGNVPVVQPPALPPTPTPVVISDWRGEYFNNPSLSGAPVVVRSDVSINFDWSSGSPAAGIGTDDFSARWTRSLNFPPGTYRFYVLADDGVRLWVGNNLVIDQWRDSAPATYTADLTLAEGVHNLRLEYYERTGQALVQLAWERLETFSDWKGEYFNNPNLNGAPVLVRNDLGIDFDWGSNSPGPGVPADNFSARWSRNISFPAGTYRFRVVVDDGLRLWLDNSLLIDRWRAGDPATYTAEVSLTEGLHSVRLEYFEFRYDAQVHLTWERVENFSDWKAEYFDNRKLQGSPVLVRNETEIDYKWGQGSPAAAVPADNFSARWTRTVDFQAGTFVFKVKVDDGVRLWLGETLLIDSWQDGSIREIEAEKELGAGRQPLKVEYYERSGEARIRVNWEKKQPPPNQAPQAVPGGPYRGDEGGLVSFDGRGSRDPDGQIVSYEWDFNYVDEIFTVDGTGPTGSRIYRDGPATKTVALRVTDDKGASHLATTQVQVRNVAPSAEAGGPYTGPVGTLIPMAGTATDPGPVDQAGLTYHWDFGDGAGGSGRMVSHSYQEAGSYTARLTVTDTDGATGADTTTVEVTVVNQTPQAVIKSPKIGQVGQVLNFKGSASSDLDGRIVSYTWDFGDNITAGGANVKHGYDAAGNYEASLTVIDNGGLSAKARRKITIEPAVPAEDPAAPLIVAPETAQLGQEVTFDGSLSDDLGGVWNSYEWDFGDGTFASGSVVSHTYLATGTYVVVLTVTDDGGREAIAVHSIYVEPNPEAAFKS